MIYFAGSSLIYDLSKFKLGITDIELNENEQSKNKLVVSVNAKKRFKLARIEQILTPFFKEIDTKE